MRVEEKIAEDTYQDKKRIEIRMEEICLENAARRWWAEKGHVRVSYFADSHEVPLDKLTILIQKQMAEHAGISIPNTAPDIEVLNTREEIDKACPKASVYSIPYSLELFYYIANKNGAGTN
jgi:hypothetical protein